MKPSSITYSHKRLLILIVSALPMPAFALAPIADSFYNYRKWIFTAYKYNLIFGLVSLAMLTATFFIWKKKMRHIVNKFCDYLESHPSTAVVSCGLLLGIPIGILCGVMYQLSIDDIIFLPFLMIMYLLPVILLIRQYRNSLVNSRRLMTVLIILSASCICASILFIIFTKLDLLPGTKDIYWNWRMRNNSRGMTHPFDSVISIWNGTIIFTYDILLCLMILWLQKACNAITKRLNRINYINQAVNTSARLLYNITNFIETSIKKYRWFLLGIVICGAVLYFY